MATKELRADIEQAVRRFNRFTLFNLKKPLRDLESHLLPGEHVLDASKAVHKGKYGLLVRTDQRLLFVHKTLMNDDSASIDLHRVASVRWQYVPTGSLLRFTADAKRFKFRHPGRDFAGGLRGASQAAA